jgi:hypothetical protein
MIEIISTISYDQNEIINNIIKLYCPNGIELDPTYSKGNFYKHIKQPLIKTDLYPQTSDVVKADANCLPIKNNSIKTMMFDPPFIVGHTKNKPTGIIGQRFHGFRYIKDLWKWYDQCLFEFHRILQLNGILIVKCQDTISSGKQWLSHCHIIDKAETIGFYCEDLFILLAKNRIIGHNHHNQKHARKFHSYFLVFRRVI